MAFSPRNLAVVVIAFASLLATTCAESYIVDKETDETLVILTALFLVLAFVLFLLSIYFVWRYYRCGLDQHEMNNRYHVSAEERNPVHVNPGQHANPFQKHSKHSQKPTINEEIYLPHYETVIGPKQNEAYEATKRIPDDVESRSGKDKNGTKNLHNVAVKERNQVNPGQHANPFQNHGKYSQKPNVHESIYLPHYETVLVPNQNEIYEPTKRKMYLPGMDSSSFRPQLEADVGNYEFAYDLSESSGKEKRDYPVLEEGQRDARISEKGGTITMTTVVSRDVHSTYGPSNENHAYDGVDETDRA